MRRCPNSPERGDPVVVVGSANSGTEFFRRLDRRDMAAAELVEAVISSASLVSLFESPEKFLCNSVPAVSDGVLFPF